MIWYTFMARKDKMFSYAYYICRGKLEFLIPCEARAEGSSVLSVARLISLSCLERSTTGVLTGVPIILLSDEFRSIRAA